MEIASAVSAVADVVNATLVLVGLLIAWVQWRKARRLHNLNIYEVSLRHLSRMKLRSHFIALSTGIAVKELISNTFTWEICSLLRRVKLQLAMWGQMIRLK